MCSDIILCSGTMTLDLGSERVHTKYEMTVENVSNEVSRTV